MMAPILFRVGGGPDMDFQQQKQMQPLHVVAGGADSLGHRIIDGLVDVFGPGTILLCIVLGAIIMFRKFLQKWFGHEDRFWRRRK